jgi:hypothetical protein
MPAKLNDTVVYEQMAYRADGIYTYLYLGTWEDSLFSNFDLNVNDFCLLTKTTCCPDQETSERGIPDYLKYT